MNVLPRAKQVEIVRALISGLGIRATERAGLGSKVTIGKIARRWRAGELPEVDREARGLAPVDPVSGATDRQRARRGMGITKRSKRGRPIQILGSDRVVSHEELMRGLVRFTALATAVRDDGGNCKDCGAGLAKPTKGRAPTRCLVCQVEENRRMARDYARRTPKAPPHRRPAKSMAAAIAGMNHKAEGKRRRTAQVRAERLAAGLCVLCGKEPGWEGTQRGAVCRAQRAEKAKAAA